MNILLKNKRYSDAEKASEDEEYREELYKEYKLRSTSVEIICTVKNNKI